MSNDCYCIEIHYSAKPKSGNQLESQSTQASELFWDVVLLFKVKSDRGVKVEEAEKGPKDLRSSIDIVVFWHV